MPSYKRWSLARISGVLIVWLFANCASAQSSCSASVVTIRSAADTTAFSPCPTFTGNIEISSAVTGNISLQGMRRLNGHIIADGAEGLTGLSADVLERIDHYMYLQRLPQLSALAFPRLSSVGDQLRLEQLPRLSTLGFDASITECPFFSVTGTAVQSIAGIDPAGTTNGFNVVNNTNLRNITMAVASTRLTVGGSVTVKENSPELGISFPHLVSSQLLELSNFSSVSLPSLVELTAIAMRSTTAESFSAPKLTHAGNDTWALLFEACPDLVDIEVPSLVDTGSFIVLDSARVRHLTLPQLQTTGLGFRLIGNMDVLSIPAIRNVSGDFVVQTASSGFDCAPFQALKDQGIIAGTFTCTTPLSNPAGSTAHASSSLTAGQKAGIGVGAGAAVLLAVLLIFSIRYRHGWRKQGPHRGPGQPPLRGSRESPAELQVEDVEKKELPGEDVEKKELPGESVEKKEPSSHKVLEMDASPVGAVNDLEPSELSANRTWAELPGS